MGSGRAGRAGNRRFVRRKRSPRLRYGEGRMAGSSLGRRHCGAASSLKLHGSLRFTGTRWRRARRTAFAANVGLEGGFTRLGPNKWPQSKRPRPGGAPRRRMGAGSKSLSHSPASGNGWQQGNGRSSGAATCWRTLSEGPANVWNG